MPSYLKKHNYGTMPTTVEAARCADWWAGILTGEYGSWIDPPGRTRATPEDFLEAFIFRAWEADQLAKKESSLLLQQLAQLAQEAKLARK